jgi:hypothetical protein
MILKLKDLTEKKLKSYQEKINKLQQEIEKKSKKCQLGSHTNNVKKKLESEKWRNEKDI